ncbi:MAG: hypothetical protein WBF27_20205, partial [Xanthobacteraceae bacterium]
MSVTCGGTMSGNCAIGIADMAMMPARVITIAMTMANRGRSMKILENIGSIFRRDSRCHDLTRPHFLDAADDNEFSRLKAGLYLDVPTLFGTGRDAPLLDFLCIVNEHHVMARLI